MPSAVHCLHSRSNIVLYFFLFYWILFFFTPKKKSCTTCDLLSHLYLHSGNCVEGSDCPSGFSFNNDSFFYFLKLTGTYPSRIGYWECLPCSDACINCLSSATECIDCANDKIWFNYSCLDSCPDGYLLSNAICIPCDSTCQTCASATTNCSSCDHRSPYRFLISNQCYSECPSGFYPDYSTLTCLNCIANCDICNNNETCIQCSQNRLITK